LQTIRLAKSFEGLNSSLAQSTGKLQSATKIAAQCVISKIRSMIYLHTVSKHVKKHLKEALTFFIVWNTVGQIISMQLLFLVE